MDTSTVRIYASEVSPRLQYIVSLIMGDIFGLPWEITTDKRKTRKQPVINYSNDDIAGAFRIVPDTLLYEKDIRPRDITITEWNGLPVFFTTAGDSDLPFDIFAASFYLVSRYEEYLMHEQDEHGRYKASSSIAFRNGFLGIPVVDMWVMEMARVFIRKFRNITVRRNEFRALLTFDTDQLFKYSGRGILESIGRIIGDLKIKPLLKSYNAITHTGKNPYEVFDYIINSARQKNAEMRFFFPVGERSRHDKNPSWKNPAYRKLISAIASQFKTGLHPSYKSAFQQMKLKAERERLTVITGRNISSSRFHYLRFRLPDSYRQLSDIGVTEDYSMGYADEPGFRAGIARPFLFYDLKKDQKTDLMIFPFQIMDETIFAYKEMNREEAILLITAMVSIVRKVGGTFTSIWHNTSLSENDTGLEARKVFEFLLNYQVNDNLPEES